ncbi:hypothetical protein OGAPHI_001068 [Ogataea philodendri]|uniref:Uncharacterized protein n=1 Tax=Ogataea philodendri TaxID=1378263 RepID=A0A9P8PE20_9ASCO|nr:uncharacterized protein OGAPHI_001068 [Ogataea philodendri]KAH3670553.1 hypothetical protein OGAPHI_001068 [Ogataea philodendri]
MAAMPIIHSWPTVPMGLTPNSLANITLDVPRKPVPFADCLAASHRPCITSRCVANERLRLVPNSLKTQPFSSSRRPFCLAFSSWPSFDHSVSTNRKYASETSDSNGISYNVTSAHLPETSRPNWAGLSRFVILTCSAGRSWKSWMYSKYLAGMYGNCVRRYSISSAENLSVPKCEICADSHSTAAVFSSIDGVLFVYVNTASALGRFV